MAEQENANKPDERRYTPKQILSWVLLIGAILFVKGFLFDQFTIPSRSMEPTLHGDTFFKGDRILVNRLAYGIRLPWTTTWLARWDTPERWEIVVFQTIEESSPHGTLVKRVVGLPGETIQVRRGQLYIDGERIEKPEGFPEKHWYASPSDVDVIKPGRDLELFKRMLEQDPMNYGVGDAPDAITIPDGHYFMMGDNSFESHDSRMYGFVPRDHLIGRTFAIWYPFTRWRDFTGFTDTWWGSIAVVGVPGAIILWIFWDLFRDIRRWLAKRKQPAA